MNTIYRQASRVLTYTGPKTENSDQALDFIKELGQRIRVWEGEMVDVTFPPTNDPRWTALHEFLERPWPSRLWIVQETLISQFVPVLLCGRREVSWDIVLKLVLLAHDSYFPFVVRHSDTDHASSLLWLGELRVAACKTAAQKNIYLVQLLRACRAQQCTDPRDKIFAILPLASDSELLQIKADYSLTAPELYTSVTARIIEQSQSLEILKAAGSEKPSNLPSWVPDWAASSTVVPFDWNEFFLADKNFHVFSAGGPKKYPSSITADTKSGVLSFQGAIIDKISLLTDIVCVKTKTKDRSWMAWFQHNRQVYDIDHNDTGKAVGLAFWLTLIAGRTHDRQKATEDYQAQCSAWMENISSQKGEKLSKPADQFLRALRRGVHMRRLCRTTGGYIGLVPGGAGKGDEICLVKGARVPFVLRVCGDFRRFIGECYVHGIMDGEALKFPGFQTQEIKVV
jgi:hypothetical protein